MLTTHLCFWQIQIYDASFTRNKEECSPLSRQLLSNADRCGRKRGGKPELPGTRVRGDWRREAGCLFWEGVCAYLLLIQTPGNERCLISCLNSPFSPLPNAPIIQRFPSLSWLGFQRKIQTKTLEQCSMEHGWRQKSKQNAFNPVAFSPPENSEYKTSQKKRMLSMDPVHY